MKIQLKEITVRELTQGYQDKGEEGVFGFNKKNKNKNQIFYIQND